MKTKNLLSKFLSIGLILALLISLGAFSALSEGNTPRFTRELLDGDKGPDVLALNKRLNELGYLESEPTDTFTLETRQALFHFQEDNGLTANGKLDEATHTLLYSNQARAKYIPMFDMVTESMAAPAGTMDFSRMPSLNTQSFSTQPFNTNEYKAFNENRFLSVLTSPLSTFAADVDTASYAQLRRAILSGEKVVPDSVRIEEMLNYFKYDYKAPKGKEPFGVTMELAKTPWNPDTHLLLIGLQAKEIDAKERPRQNLVFLIDVSGSMDSPDKLPLVKRSFLLLLEELGSQDTISIVTYASRDEVVLDGVNAGEKTAIMDKIDSLQAGGSTAGADGINTAYELAKKHFIKDGNNRIILATDGDLNVGISDEGSLGRLVTEKKKDGIFLSVLGFGDGNYKDNKLEALADKGNGNYAYIDTIYEARRALVTEIGATFFTVAKDVKLQVDFNPAFIKGYRLIGYENRLLEAEDFADDTKDGGELGSGHRLSVLYELVPVGSAFEFGETGSKYSTPEDNKDSSEEMLTLSIRSKTPDGDASELFSYPLMYREPGDMTDNLKLAAAIAQMGMLLKDSELKGTSTYESALDLLRDSKAVSGDPYKEELVYLITLLQRQENLAK